MNRLDRQVVLITGATGGLGRALSEGFAREGCQLFVSDLDKGQVEGLVEELRHQGTEAAGSAFDLRQVDQSRSMVEHAIKAYGRIDILVNNAGVASTKSIWDLTEDDWDSVFDVNVKSLFFVLQSVARHMVNGGGGSIINIASVAGRAGRPMLLHYAASKAAVISITRSAALALANQRVRVNAIAPGMIDTELLHALQSAYEETAGNGNSMLHNPSVDKVPLGRIAQPGDIVGTAIYLASHDSEYTTGQTINVCGGLVMS
jgi:NAD(P)-dependent dehydrogenase (short-subunit alcohol dehydrogenase family)